MRSVTKKMLILIGAAVLLVCILAVPPIFDNFGKAPEPEPVTSGALIDSGTGAVMEYSLEVLRPEEIENELVQEWVSGIQKTGGGVGYHTLYNNSSDVMDMYLISQAANQIIGAIGVSNVKAAESGTALIINIDTDKEAKADLILHIYAMDASQSAKAKSELLIVNGNVYTCMSSTFMSLG